MKIAIFILLFSFFSPIFSIAHGPYTPPYSPLRIKILWLELTGEVLSVDRIYKTFEINKIKKVIDLWMVTVRIKEKDVLLLVVYIEPSKDCSPIISVSRLDKPQFEKEK